MARRETRIRTLDDLRRAARSLSRHFNTDTIYVIGSQAVLVGWPDAPVRTRMSPEIDAYPKNASAWSVAHGGIEASEEINALFGFGSNFHVTFGFYIDGVDEHTATLPPDWRSRAVRMAVDDEGRTIAIVAPALEDLVVSKLARLDDKDKEFIVACHAAASLDREKIKKMLQSSRLPTERERIAMVFLASLPLK